MTQQDRAWSHRQQSPEPAGSTTLPPLTLAENHTLLLAQVAARAGELTAAIVDGGWFVVELAALAHYAQAEVMSQASDEETLLFPAASPRDAAGLARDHTRLRSAAELLARASAGEQRMPPEQVAVAARDFVALLERHLRAEEETLVAPTNAGPAEAGDLDSVDLAACLRRSSGPATPDAPRRAS